MILPELPIPNQTKEIIQTFGGYNHNIRIADNEFFNMRNLSVIGYPTLSPRQKRGIVKSLPDCNGLLSKDKLAYISGNKLYYGEQEFALNEGITEERQIVSMGAYILVFPDEYYVNTKDTTDHGSISGGYYELNTENEDLSFYLSTVEGNEVHPLYITKKGSASQSDEVAVWELLQSLKNNRKISTTDNCYVAIRSDGNSPIEVTLPFDNTNGSNKSNYVYIQDQSVAQIKEKNMQGTVFTPLKSGITTVEVGLGSGSATYSRYYYIIVKDTADPTDGEYWLQTDGDSEVGQLYVASGGRWEAIKSCIKAKSGMPFAKEAFARLKQQKTCRLRISSDKEALQYITKKYSELNAFDPISCGEDYFLLEGSLNNCSFVAMPSNTKIELSLDLPEMDFVMESGNRLWGCKYGLNKEGDFLNEIYASELGNFFSWYSFKGISTDSYAASVGTDGVFTGAVNYKGKPIFFKENCTHSIYGSYPSNFQISTEAGIGLEEGSARSLCIVNNALYYKATDGVYRYDGASYDKLSFALGDVSYSNASGGSIDNKYYIAMTSEEGKRELFVYDISKGLWHKEDEVQAYYFARHKNDLYFYDNSSKYLYTVKASEGEAESDPITWEAETGPIGYNTIDAKYLDKIQLRISLPVGSAVRFFIEYDTDGYFEYFGNITGKSSQAFTLPLFPRRCDHFRLRLNGEGECKIFSLIKVIEDGGEL
ncbi:MAG: hypothetical protein J6U86_04450 [Clostridia bacterium]|nr:hypothetical protein [Clostridia bacterium]